MKKIIIIGLVLFLISGCVTSSSTWNSFAKKQKSIQTVYPSGDSPALLIKDRKDIQKIFQ